MAVNKENSCAFYASDYHLEMIMLPYINKNLEENKNIYVFTQNNLEETINNLVGKVNIRKQEKEKILNINWKTDDENKYNRLIKDNNETLIFIKGNENYINKVNKNLEQLSNNKNMEIIDCYNIEEIGINTNSIIKNHKDILTMRGKNNKTVK